MFLVLPRLYFFANYVVSVFLSADYQLNYNVVKYVPYGPVNEVLPYLTRRIEENSSVKGQLGREIKLIKRELKRRKYYSQ